MTGAHPVYLHMNDLEGSLLFKNTWRNPLTQKKRQNNFYTITSAPAIELIAETASDPRGKWTLFDRGCVRSSCAQCAKIKPASVEGG